MVRELLEEVWVLRGPDGGAQGAVAQQFGFFGGRRPHVGDQVRTPCPGAVSDSGAHLNTQTK